MVISIRAFFGAKVQQKCTFCDRTCLENVLYEDGEIIAFENVRKAGVAHWLIIPVRHMRDIERLGSEDASIVPKLDAVKRELLRLFYPDLPSSQIHAGYHRGHRPMLGRFGLPDIVSIHHLHLHVIIYPFSLLKLFKYPAWFPLMWVSDEWLLKNIAKREESS